MSTTRELWESFVDILSHASREMDVLNLALLCFLVLSFIVVIVVGRVSEKIITWKKGGSGEMVRNSHNGPLNHKGNHVASAMLATSDLAGEWLNTVLSWLYHHQTYTPELVNCFIRALNGQTRRQGSSVQVTFDRITAGSKLPYIANLNITNNQAEDCLTASCYLEVEDVHFVLLATQQTPASMKLSTCDAAIHQLSGYINCRIECVGEDMELTIAFEKDPVIKLDINPLNAVSNELVDLEIVEELVRNALAYAITVYSVSKPNTPFDVAMTTASSERTAFQPVQSRKTQQVPPKPPRVTEIRDKRLLVKVIKASSLGASAEGSKISMEPFCTVEMDYPNQTHKTNVVRDTANPFWDEHFLFDLSSHTRFVHFQVVDRSKPPGGDFLGEATVSIESLCKNPSTRQIIPLHAKKGQPADNSFGSITLEFLFMEPAQKSFVGASKKVETSRTTTPGGTVITTTTTTTTKPKLSDGDKRLSSLNDVPTKVIKSPVTENHLSSLQRSNSNVSSSSENELQKINELGSESLAETAIRHLMVDSGRKTPTKKSTLIIQGVSKSPLEELNLPPSPELVRTKKRDASPNRSLRRFFGLGKKGKKQHSSHGDITSLESENSQRNELLPADASLSTVSTTSLSSPPPK